MAEGPLPPPGLLGELRELSTPVAASVRAAVLRETPRRRLAWVAAAALLALAPLAFNLTRESRFEASVEIFPREVGPYRAIQDPRYYRSLLDDAELRRQMQLYAGEATGDEDDVTIGRGSKPGTLTLSVESRSPEQAQAFTDALAPQIANATTRELARSASQDAKRLRGRLLRGRLSNRRRVKGRRRRLIELSGAPTARVVLGAPSPSPPAQRWADRVVDDLPGEFSRRPNPVWVALAGLLVTAALWGICQIVFPPGRGPTAAA